MSEGRRPELRRGTPSQHPQRPAIRGHLAIPGGIGHTCRRTPAAPSALLLYERARATFMPECPGARCRAAYLTMLADRATGQGVGERPAFVIRRWPKTLSGHEWQLLTWPKTLNGHEWQLLTWLGVAPQRARLLRRATLQSILAS